MPKAVLMPVLLRQRVDRVGAGDHLLQLRRLGRARREWTPPRRRGRAACSARCPSRPSAAPSPRPSGGRARCTFTPGGDRRAGSPPACRRGPRHRCPSSRRPRRRRGAPPAVKVETSSGLCGEATPPPAVSLICEAPCMSCSRTRRRTSSGLSATMLPPICSIRDERPADRARQLGQLAEIAVAAGDGDHRAGGIDARARRRRRRRWPASAPKAGPPMSRTVVKPRISVSSASAAATRLM